MASIFQAPRLLLGAFLLFLPDNEMLMLFGHRGHAVDILRKPRVGRARPLCATILNIFSFNSSSAYLLCGLMDLFM